MNSQHLIINAYISRNSDLIKIHEIDTSILKQEKLSNNLKKRINDACHLKQGELGYSDSVACSLIVNRLHTAYCFAISNLNPLIEVEGGILPQGSSRAGSEVKGFYIGIYAVTMEEWLGVRRWAVLNGYCIARGEARSLRHPVTNISWLDAVKWCNALSEMCGLDPCYTIVPKQGGQKGYLTTFRKSEPANDDSLLDVTILKSRKSYRLPKASEWEWAARGGVKSRGYTFSGSNNLDEVAWNTYNGHCRHGMPPSVNIQEVGKKAPNELGIYDMSGNVAEWCENEVKIKGNSFIERRVLGPSTSSFESYQVNFRGYERAQDYGSEDCGFRLAINL
jgi:sulfatase modifying factor 1